MIKYYNRKVNKYEVEKIVGDKYFNWIYFLFIGMSFLEIIFKKKFFLKVYGFFCDSKVSCKKIDLFINDFNIDVLEFEKKIDEFKFFNDFFIRKLKNKFRLIDISR